MKHFSHMEAPEQVVPPSAQGAILRFMCSLGARILGEQIDPPKREPSWQYLRYLERRQREIHNQLVLWVGVAIMVTIALAAVSTISTWPQ